MANALPQADKRLVEAVDWAVKVQFNKPDAATKQAFQHWLKAHPSNAAAWRRVSSVQENFRNLPPGVAKGVLDSVDRVRSGNDKKRRATLKLLLLAAVAGPTAWLVSKEAPWQRLIASESTGVGEIRSLQLEDGTVITLNTDSAISIHFGEARREITLHRGEILVVTGADAEFTGRAGVKRSFWVHTHVGRLQALGTRFTVRREDSRARISLQEGAIELTPASNPQIIPVLPGQTWWLYSDRGELAAPSGIGIDDWKDGLIVADNARMADLVAEIARYRRGLVTCDESVSDLRVSGLYHIADTDKTLRFLSTTQPVDLRFMTRYWVQVSRKQPG
ncbi:FecR domain-containing protein [Herbaspirillum sp. alder98]|uniref:FecR domain-containing protein n=1 Tax=Herbaspirillum sp. alder98 TaxID=2913096 RepID=UPI001CD909A7|nr:FecR domain-containing protein [Herbaspirillum sp. alder98]MCA1323576.1 FecR domain-containing protein [Herbaspirillum sp. alder98]